MYKITKSKTRPQHFNYLCNAFFLDIKEDCRFEVKDFLYSDIYEEGILDRVKESDKTAKEYYAEQDAEKQKLIDEQK